MWAGVAAAVAFLAVLVVVPLFELFRTGTEQLATTGAEVLDAPGTASAAVNTLWTGTAVTLLAVGGGTAAALVTERSTVTGRRWLRAGLLLPLFVPPFVAAMSWLRTYGPSGFVDDLVGISLPGLVGPLGVVLVIAVHVMPLAYLVVVAGLAVRAQPDLERAARASGAAPWTAFRTVTLPLLTPTLLGAGALVFVAAINSFGIPAILGIPAGFATITTRIYQDLARAADPAVFTRAVLLASTLVIAALVVIGIADSMVGRAEAAMHPGSPAGPGGRRRRRQLGGTVLWTYLALTSGLPLVVLVLVALTRAVGLAPVPENWTLENFGDALTPRLAGAAGRSVLLAVTAATIVLLLGSLLAALRRRRHGPKLGTVALLTFAVPGSTLAVAVLLAYGPWWRDTLLLILVAYVAKFWAIGHRTISGPAEGLSPDVARAARVSGAGPVVALRTVVLPQLRTALAAAWLLVFLFGLHELTMSSLLYGPGTDTLAVAILNLQQIGDVTVTSALAVMLTVPVLALSLPLLVHRRLGARLMGLE